MLLAAPVDPNVAQQVADNFINAPETDASGTVHKAPRKQKRMARAPKQITNNQQFYIFNSEDGEGFVIVAADNVAHPILGYSKTGSLEIENLPENLRWWLSEYDRQISWARINNIAQSDEIAQEWQQSLANHLQTATPVVAPLIQTQWDQLPYYNEQCPYYTKYKYKIGNYYFGEDGTYYTPVGCGATALAQVMKYYNWPQQGTGYKWYSTVNCGKISANFAATTYNWDNMPVKLDENSTQTQIDAVAKLMFHCGVAMHMNYTPTESGIKDPDSIVSAVKKYFRYNPNTRTVRKAQYTETGWKAILKAQLDAGQPMVYTGMAPSPGKGGHAFVCDGYDSDDYFHFNWGWSGQAEGAYYSLQALTPSVGGAGAGELNYTDQQAAIVDMTPRTTANAANLQLNSDWNLSSTSIVYGGSISANVSVKNYGTSAFTGDISLLVLDKNYNYFNSLPLKTGYTLNPGAVVSLNPSVQQYAGLIPGQYYVTLVYSNADSGLQLVGSEYHTNAAMFTVYYYAELEMYSDITITNASGSHEFLCNSETTITATIKNNSNTKFKGLIGLVLFKDDMSVGQDFGTITIDGSGIAAGGTKTISCVGTTTLEPNTYILGYMYQRNDGSANVVGSRYYPNPTYVIVREAYINEPQEPVTVKAKMPSNWGTTISAWVWEDGSEGHWETLENEGEWYSFTSIVAPLNIVFVNGSTWNGDNNQSVDIRVAESTCIQLNSNAGKRTYTIIDCEEVQEQAEYYIVAKRNSGNYYFFTPEKVSGKNRLIAVDAGTSVRANIDTIHTTADYLWTFENSKLKSHNGQYLACTAAKSAIMNTTGTELTKTDNSDGSVTFSYLADTETRYLSLATSGNDYYVFYANANQFTHLLMLPKGQESTTQVPVIDANNQAQKILHNGQILILRGDKTYTLTGAEVK